ncbi:hypothetical protein PIB30_062728 [Stylosanthes scabra]|uniref:Uncharacterized protein n=1 Tax=Stylosanthes scabra TaxID=79078 RepID=A0ABU6WKT6_9FABA|nr:hypothetical protein [Stylosanthes scabra]
MVAEPKGLTAEKDQSQAPALADQGTSTEKDLDNANKKGTNLQLIAGNHQDLTRKKTEEWNPPTNAYSAKSPPKIIDSSNKNNMQIVEEITETLLTEATNSQRAQRLGAIQPTASVDSKSQLSEASSQPRLSVSHPMPSVELLLKTTSKAAHPRLGVQHPRPAWRLPLSSSKPRISTQQGHAQAPDTPRLGVGSS